MAYDYLIKTTADVNRANVSVPSWSRGRKALLSAVVDFLTEIKDSLPNQISSGQMGFFTLDETTGRVKVNHFISTRIPSDNMFAAELSHSEMDGWKQGIKRCLVEQDTWSNSWDNHLTLFNSFGFGSAGRDSGASYSAAAMTTMAESLQCLACAARQEIGSLDADIFSQVVTGEHPKTNAIRRHTKIDPQFFGDGYPSLKHFYEMTDGGPEWVRSSAEIANTLEHHYLSGTYNFYRQDQYPKFKGNYETVKKRIKTGSSSSPMIKKIFNVTGMAADKWNPADIIAVKTSFESQKDYDMKSATGLKLSNDVRALTQNRVQTYDELAKLYDYNQWIHEQYESRNIVPISLKKAGNTVKHEVISNADVGQLSMHEQMEIKVTSVEYSASNQKCIIEFDIGGVSGYKLDARGFEESGKIADIQIQLMKEGSTAAHGKVTLPVTEIIAKLSRGRRHFTQLAQLRRQVFGRNAKMGFMEYRDIQNQTRTAAMIIENAPAFGNYIQRLSKGNHTAQQVRSEMDTFISRNQILQAQKYLKNKIQSYEVGYMLDNDSSHLQEQVKNNILKSMYLYASSKGFFIFDNAKTVSFLQSSTYVKVGG